MKKLVSYILILSVCFSLLPAAFGEGILGALESSGFDRSADDAWDNYVNLLLDYTDSADPGPYGKLAFGYYNFLTGEEYYYNGDEYMIAASLYKVPLNMAAADGKSPDEQILGMKMSEYQYFTLCESSNELSENLFNSMGGYGVFKNTAKEYCCDSPDEEVPYNFSYDNIFTARQMIRCLKVLQGDPDRFPGVLDAMKINKEDASFKRDVQWCEIASKNGWYSDGTYHTVANDLGVVYTTQTFAIVMMTDNMPNSNELMADYCTLMCDYTNTRNYARKDRIKELMSRLDNC